MNCEKPLKFNHIVGTCWTQLIWHAKIVTNQSKLDLSMTTSLAVPPPTTVLPSFQASTSCRLLLAGAIGWTRSGGIDATTWAEMGVESGGKDRFFSSELILVANTILVTSIQLQIHLVTLKFITAATLTKHEGSNSTLYLGLSRREKLLVNLETPLSLLPFVVKLDGTMGRILKPHYICIIRRSLTPWPALNAQRFTHNRPISSRHRTPPWLSPADEQGSWRL